MFEALSSVDTREPERARNHPLVTLLRVLMATASFCGGVVTTAILVGALDVYWLGHVDDKWGGPFGNFMVTVEVYGVYAALLMSPIAAAGAWLVCWKGMVEGWKFYGGAFVTGMVPFGLFFGMTLVV